MFIVIFILLHCIFINYLLILIFSILNDNIKIDLMYYLYFLY